MKVKRVTKIGLAKPVPVYDITVPGTECFVLGNGCVVHNSKDIADAVCGAYYTLLTRATTWMDQSDDDNGTKYRADTEEVERFIADRQD